MTIPTRSIGPLIREWRQRRRLSQFELAREAHISPRQLSFLETGRAMPGREMLLHLAERLMIPLRARNEMLDAAGLAQCYPERPMDDPGFRMTRRSIDLILSMHEPNPAVAIDRHWTMVASNRAAANLIAGVVPLLLTPPVNMIRLSLHPAGLAPRIINLAEWRRHLIFRLRRQIEMTGDPVLLDLVDEVSAYPQPTAASGQVGPPDVVAVPLRLATVHGPLAFFSTTTVFGGPNDITLAELAIEAFFPADPATETIMRRMAAEHVPASASAPAQTTRPVLRAAIG
jgi:transcriptional regulator with XRE-family HTH domain